MIHNAKVGTIEDRPFVQYEPELHDTPEQRAVCENCTLDDCEQDDPRCQFATPRYEAERLAAMERQAAYLCHVLVMKPVYRAVGAIREELRQ